MNRISHNEEILQAALSYAARGWPVLPVRGKKAALSDWPHMSTTAQELPRLWFGGAHAGANVAVVTGIRSGFFVLDIDQHGADGEEALAALEAQYGALPETVEQLTGGGGRHLLFKMPRGAKLINRTGKNAIIAGVEIKAEGGYIVAPPSIHPVTGRAYEWEANHHPDDIPIADAPAWLISLATAKPEPLQSAPVHVDKISEGSRNDHLTRLAGSMRRPGMSEEAILAALRVENETRCIPPLPDKELQTISKSVARYAPELGAAAAVAKSHPMAMAGSFFNEQGQFIPPLLVQHIMKHHFIAVQNQQLFVYHDGVYNEITIEFVKNLCKNILFDRYRDNRGTEVAKQIITACWRSDDFFSSDTKEINMQNGILNWRAGQLRPHSPEYPSRVRIPVTFDPDAKCPRIEKFLTDVLHPDCLPMVAQIFGYCLIPDVSMQKAFLLKSGGESGKSVFLDLLTAFIGRANVSHEKLPALGENRFRAANLQGKLANVFADLPSCYLEETDTFKVLVSGDAISAERKGKDPFVFRNTARLLFSANELPRSADNSHGFFRRWIIIDFPHSFPPGDPRRDERLIDKLTTPEELSGLLNLALDGLRQLYKRGYFEEPASCRAELDEYKRTNDSVRLFFDERITLDNNLRVDRATLFRRYREFCLSENLKAVGGRRFCAKLREICPGIDEIKSCGVNYWLGIACEDIGEGFSSRSTFY